MTLNSNKQDLTTPLLPPENNAGRRESVTERFEKVTIITGASVNDNPRLGIAYFLISGVCSCLTFCCGKVLYKSHPELTVVKLLGMRAMISMTMLLLVNFGRMKNIMIDSVTKKDVKFLLLRVV